ncbi:MAG: hypothetical protein R2822_28175 [Spirosomataceae bacterium]
MKLFKLLLTYLLGAFMVFGGVNHFLNPAMYLPFIPSFFSKELVNYGTGIVEIIFGMAVFIPAARYWGTLGILVLMLVFLPLHIWDVFRNNPAIGSHQAALIRLPIQFVLIAWAWFIDQKNNDEKTYPLDFNTLCISSYYFFCPTKTQYYLHFGR